MANPYSELKVVTMLLRVKYRSHCSTFTVSVADSRMACTAVPAASLLIFFQSPAQHNLSNLLTESRSICQHPNTTNMQLWCSPGSRYSAVNRDRTRPVPEADEEHESLLEAWCFLSEAWCSLAHASSALIKDRPVNRKQSASYQGASLWLEPSVMQC